MTNILRKLITGAVFTFSAMVIVPLTAHGQAKQVLNTDFEKGTQKWEARGPSGVTIRSTDKEAASGKKSLQVRGRTEFWQGAQLNVTELLKAGVTYRFKVSVKLESGSSPVVLKMTLQRGDTAFYSVAASTVTDSEWTTLTGSYRPDGKDAYLLVYVESEAPRVSYFLDDFTIEAVEVDANQRGVVLKTDFQDGTQQNWLVFGDGLQVFSGQIGDNVVLKVDGRKSSDDGLALDVTPYLFPGKKYRMSVSVFLGGGPAKDTVKIVVRRTASDGKVTYDDVAGSDSVSGTSWTKISGEYEVPGDGSYLVIVRAKGDKTAYFVDDFELEAL